MVWVIELDMRDHVDHTHHLISIGLTELEFICNRRQIAGSMQADLGLVNEWKQVRAQFLYRCFGAPVPQTLKILFPRTKTPRCQPLLDQRANLFDQFFRPGRQLWIASEHRLFVASKRLFQDAVNELTKPKL